MNSKFLIILSTLLAAGHAQDVEGYKIYEIAAHREQCKTLRFQARADVNQYVLTPSCIPPGYPTRILVLPEGQRKFENSLNGIDFKIINHNDDSKISRCYFRADLNAADVFFNRTMEYDEIENYLDKLAGKYPQLVTLETVGKSFEKRNIKTITIGKNKRGTTPVIFIDAGMLGDDLSAPVTALYIIKQLVEHSERYEKILSEVTFVILPLVNPDGYVYSLTRWVHWKNTRSVDKGTECVGARANLNFDVFWKTVEKGCYTCDIFGGRIPFSEPETQAVRNVMESYFGRLKIYLSFTTSRQRYILLPAGYHQENVSAFKNLVAVARARVEKLNAENQSRWRVETRHLPRDDSAGRNDDYAYVIHRVPYVFTMNLPVTSFEPKPEDGIELSANNTWEAIQSMIAEMLKQGNQ